MKQIQIISSLLIFVQVINCDPVTFAQVVQSFNTKANATGVKLKSSLDFLVKISEKARFIKAFNMRDVPLFTTREEREEVLAEVLKRTTVNGMNATDFLRKEIISIDFDQTQTITQLKEDIIKGLNFAAPSKYDVEFGGSFDHSFNEWHVKRAKKSEAQNVKDKLNVMIKQDTKLKERFDTLATEITELSFKLNHVGINECSSKLNSLLTEILPAGKIATIKTVVKQFTEIKNNQAMKMRHMQEMKHTLSRYNVQRTIWARFIIGLEKTPRLA
ncbi:uncharacterized protein LOC116350364 [Contarinia nasturtii]|uniref:uncharacterized protein LOC116350364 n=1 Tax=Contarinia nasturtii TaxID=265458 RepID=UPI0012D40A21|nr:uncharacterized protein LOC116350364 [Contarinia nasturtii]